MLRIPWYFGLSSGLGFWRAEDIATFWLELKVILREALDRSETRQAPLLGHMVAKNAFVNLSGQLIALGLDGSDEE